MKITFLSFLCGCLLLISLPTWSASTKEELKALSAQVEAMQKDLKEIKKMLQDSQRNAEGASMAALCANDQGKCWEMHNVMFDNQRALTDENLKTYAANFGMDKAKFDRCLDSKKYARQIDEDIVLATKLGISGTPGFILGLTDSDDSGEAQMSKFIKGAQPLAVFKAAIDELLEAVN